MITVELDIVDTENDQPVVYSLGTFDYDPIGDDSVFIQEIAERIRTVDAEVSIKYSLRLLNKYLIRTLTKEFVSSAPVQAMEYEIRSHLEKCLQEYKKASN